MYLAEGLASLHTERSLEFYNYSGKGQSTFLNSEISLTALYHNRLHEANLNMSTLGPMATQELDSKPAANGYRWGFQGTSIDLPILVLVLQALMALTHSHDGVEWLDMYKLDNMGEMLILAIDSLPIRRLKNMSAGVEKMKTRKEITGVRELGDNKLHVVVGEKLGEEGSVSLKPEAVWKYS